MEESRKVYGWLVRDRNAAVGCSSIKVCIFRQVVNYININGIIYT